MAANNSIPLTQEYLRDILHYDAETGIFTRKRAAGTVKQGSIASCKATTGYICIRVNHKSYLAHRLAWLYVHGVWPKNLIDHIDGNRSNNVFTNIRESTYAENMQNQKKARGNSMTGYLGVGFHRKTKTWVARIRVHGKLLYLGYHKTPEIAHDAYIAAKRIHHPFFAN